MLELKIDAMYSKLAYQIPKMDWIILVELFDPVITDHILEQIFLLPITDMKHV